jgi:hypothetical protein
MSKQSFRFVAYLPFRFEPKDRKSLQEAVREMLFGNDRLAPELEAALPKDFDHAAVARFLAEPRPSNDAKASNAFIRLFSKEGGIHLGPDSFEVGVEAASSRKMRAFLDSLRSADGRKSVFVVITPPKDVRLSSDGLDVAVLMAAAAGSCRTFELPEQVRALLDRAGVNVDRVLPRGRAPLTRLTEKSRSVLAKYGLHEHDFGGISIRVNPNVDENQGGSKNFLRQHSLSIDDFKTSRVN